jgi:mono/diheme cytochrome c family protein
VSADPAHRSMRLALSLLAPLLAGCSWFTDFKEQPKIDPWESFPDSVPYRGQPHYSVPITGTAVPAYRVSYAALPATIDSMAGVANPVPADERSLANGHKYFAVNCAVCHGYTGAGDGPAVRYGMAGISLLTPVTTARTDGYIFGMIRNGRGLMPTYNRIEEMDRWDVVNYVRALQGRVPNSTGGITAYGYPGQNGATVPGPSHTAPTRPAPMWHASAAAAAPAGATPVQGTPTDSTARPNATTPTTDSAQTKRGTP